MKKQGKSKQLSDIQTLEKQLECKIAERGTIRKAADAEDVLVRYKKEPIKLRRSSGQTWVQTD